MKQVLSVETSCDDTCVALVQEDGFVPISYRQTQDEVHRLFGGIVPERASRNHSHYLLPLIDQVLKHSSINSLYGLVYTNRPGLLGSLLVGAVTVKTLAMLNQKPSIAINHIEGHILSPFLHDSENKILTGWSFPYLVLVVSGGHTHLFEVKKFGDYRCLGQTLDDAAGEAFDKFAQMLNLSYANGVQVDQQSQKGSADRFDFPVAMMKKKNLNFSFSGLKNSARLLLSRMNHTEIERETPSLCASYQEAIVDQIIFKLTQCIQLHSSYQRVAIVGGVSANSCLRKKCMKWAKRHSIQLAIPSLCYCTDNAAMIGYAGIQRLLRGETSSLQTACFPNHQKGDFVF